MSLAGLFIAQAAPALPVLTSRKDDASFHSRRLDCVKIGTACGCRRICEERTFVIEFPAPGTRK
jgi:hypothetical protein